MGNLLKNLNTETKTLLTETEQNQILYVIIGLLQLENMTFYTSNILWSLSNLLENAEEGPIAKLCFYDTALAKIVKYA